MGLLDNVVRHPHDNDIRKSQHDAGRARTMFSIVRAFFKPAGS
jgi:hypothetical protein